MKTRINVGTRGSRLALIQTGSVVDKIKQLNPQVAVDIIHVVTTGDKNRSTPLVRLGTSIFIKELEEALLNKRIDLAVHSLKDVPTEIPRGLKLLAVTEREDPRDTLIAKTSLNDLPVGCRIGTDSLRRSVQLTVFRSDLNICSLRGNIDTRVNKVLTGVVDGAVIAAAALKRLGWEKKITEYLPLDTYLPAAGQGAIVIEARQDDREVADLIAPLNHSETWWSITAERAFLRALGGGCRAPIAALGTISHGYLKLKGMVGSLKHQKLLCDSEEGDSLSAEEIGIKLARRLLELGGAKYIAEVIDQ